MFCRTYPWSSLDWMFCSFTNLFMRFMTSTLQELQTVQDFCRILMIAFIQPNSLLKLLMRLMCLIRVYFWFVLFLWWKTLQMLLQIHRSSNVYRKATENNYWIISNMTCNRINAMCFLECSICGLQYVEESKQPFHWRLNK